MKTAAELQITEREHAFLIRARDILTTMTYRMPAQVPGDGTFLFDMGTVLRPLSDTELGIDIMDSGAVDRHYSTLYDPGPTPGTYACGSAGCIAGLMNLLAGLEPEGLLWPRGSTGGLLPQSHPLYPLFFPHRLDYRSVTPSDAAQAIDRFLTTGRAEWAWDDFRLHRASAGSPEGTSE